MDGRSSDHIGVFRNFSRSWSLIGSWKINGVAMTTSSAPREFWIERKKIMGGYWEAYEHKGQREPGCIHVIEYSALTALQKENEILKKQFEGHENCRTISIATSELMNNMDKQVITLEAKLASVEKLILQELEDIGSCDCGFDEQIGEGYRGGTCRLHEALSKIKGAVK
jgi:hypothetical protein